MIPSLSDRQIECLRLVAQGVTSSKVIADRLGLAPSSVDNYLSRAAASLGVRGRDEAAAAFLAAEAAAQQHSVRASVSRTPDLADDTKSGGNGVVTAVRWLLTLPPIGGGRHDLNRVEIVFSILKVAVFSFSVFTALVLLGSGLLWLIDR